MVGKLTYAHVKSVFEGRGFTLLSKEYLGSTETLDFSCPEGHLRTSTWKTFCRTKYKGDQCSRCLKETQKSKLPLGKETRQSQRAKEKAQYLETYGYKFLGDGRKIKVMCPEGHTDSIYFSNFKKGNRCFECHGSKKYTIEFVRDYVDQQGYSLLSTEYVSSNKDLDFLCPRGHTYTTTWYKFYRRQHRCSSCSGKGGGFDIHRVAAEFHGRGYTLLSDSYTTSLEKLEFSCDKGHKHSMALNNLLAGQKCGKCFNEFDLGRSSKPERELISRYEDMGLGVVSGSREIIAPYEVDLYFPESKVAVEYCGLYWHSDKFKDRNYHYKKMIMCQGRGIRLITVFEDEFLERPNIVLSRIDNALGISNTRIYARSCSVVAIPVREAYCFLDEYHLQGKGTAQAAYALLSGDQVISVMSLGAVTRQHTARKGKVLELKRLASIPGTVVVGGASKLFKYAKMHAVSSGCTDIRSYCDMRWANLGSTVYDCLGFTKTSYSKYTPHYFKGQKRYRNFSMRKTPEERLTGKTEYSLRSDQGYKRIWDCGHSTYNYKLQGI